MLFPILSFLTLLSGIVVASYLAFRLGRRLGSREAERTDREHEAAVGSHVAATLGLLAFTIAIVFNMAHEKHSGRKALVRKDALSILTAYERARLLPAEEVEAARQRLTEYTKVRAFDVFATTDAEIERLIARSDEIQRELWQQVSTNKDSKDIWFYAEALNQLDATHMERVTMGMHDRIPTPVWYILALVAMFAMAVMGYQSGLTGSRRAIAIIPLAFVFSLVLSIAIDLDRPRDGMLRIEQDPMQRLYDSLQAP